MTYPERIERDLELFGVAYTVNGVRVAPEIVVRYERPKKSVDDSDRTNEDWREKACGICNRHICRCAEFNLR